MPRTTTKPARVAKPKITVRMYCHGLGDCFLVSIPQKDKPFWLMIDFGILLGTPDGGNRMKAVIDSIHKTTGGSIDLLVVTHQHWDHVSGFSYAQQEFLKLKITEVWYAWTEDPADELGVELQRTRSKAAFAVEKALGLMNNDSTLRQGIADLMLGFGVDGDVDPAKSKSKSEGKGSLSTAEAMKLPGENFPTKYRKPGETIERAGVNFHILGPPRDERIFRSDPSKKASEVYESLADKVHAFGLGQSMGMVEAVEGLRSDTDEMLTRPFYVTHCRDIDKVADHYPSYTSETASWRTIDHEWQEIVEQLALQLDSDTNNTSLVFAIEIPETQKVLLFAADAQVGNWLSWHDQKWTVKAGDKERTMTATDLLNRTVLYKVGHHGSHNATLREKGLELMTSPELCAMIPVEVEMARKKNWFEMPLDVLVDRLREKTGGKKDDPKTGRVAKADDPSTFRSPFRPSKEMNTFVNPPRPLYVELDIE
jgi:hypothetical protein